MPGYHQQRDHRPGPAARPAPELSGQLVAAFARPGYRGAPAGELRVSVDEFNGHPYLSLRLFEQDRDGNWWPTKKGLSVRLGEAEGVAAALMSGLELAGGIRGQRNAGQGGRDRYRLQPEGSRPRSAPVRATVAPQRALPAPGPEAAPAYSAEFDEFGGVRA